MSRGGIDQVFVLEQLFEENRKKRKELHEANQNEKKRKAIRPKENEVVSMKL